jgi:2-polyprenyl-6-methoxyphenol hydroxylase-like FAD-dependent oxidoreductase
MRPPRRRASNRSAARRAPLRGRHAIVIGAGITGLAAAQVLLDRGARVTLLERDAERPTPTAREAFTRWRRRGAPQVRHSHAFLGRLRNLLRDRHPHLLTALRKAGARELRMIDAPPLTLGTLRPEPGDDELVALGCRRTTFEWVLRREILRRPGVELVSGATVQRLLATRSQPPCVTGVTYGREGGLMELAGDFVVDASGRTSKALDWLRAIGARRVYEEQESSGIIYYTRFYRLRPRVKEPLRSRDPAIADYQWIKFAIFPADDRTFSITFAVPLALPRLKVLVKRAAFDAMVESIPGLVPWARAAHPLDDLDHPVQAMGGLINRLRRFVDGDGPVAEGLFVLGDAAYCTNPLYGRGCTQGFLHAELLGEALDACGGDLCAAATVLDRLACEQIEPFYRASLLADRDAVRKAEGRPAAGLTARFRERFFEEGVVIGTRCDPVIFRAFARMFNMLETPEQAFGRPEVIARALWIMARGAWWNRRYALPALEDRDTIIARCEAAA